MEKQDDSKGQVLSREEMKNTKGGAGHGAVAQAQDLTRESLVVDQALAADPAAVAPSSPVAQGAKSPVPPIVAKR